MRIIIYYILVVAICQADRDCSQIKFLDPLCGGSDSRIVEGKEAAEHSFPYQAALFINTSEGVSFCGGSLISKNYVLTAAHCVASANNVEVVLGAHNILQEEDTQKLYNGTVAVHGKWSITTLENDIAVVKLEEEAKLNENIDLVTLPQSSDVGQSYKGKLATVSGWGRCSDKSENISKVLRYVESKVMSDWLCSLMSLGQVKSSHICTSASGKKGSCNGYSGGPLVVEGKQVGIVSFGFLKCKARSCYTRVTEYLDWIQENTDVKIK